MADNIQEVVQMKYVIFDYSEHGLSEPILTTDPVAYVQQFEPYDVVDMSMVCLGADNKWYTFSLERYTKKSDKITKNTTVVDVGLFGVSRVRIVEIKDDCALDELVTACLKLSEQNTSNESNLRPTFNQVIAAIDP